MSDGNAALEKGADRVLHSFNVCLHLFDALVTFLSQVQIQVQVCKCLSLLSTERTDPRPDVSAEGWLYVDLDCHC